MSSNNLANGGNPMKGTILFFSLLLIVSCVGCSRQPEPRVNTAKLTITLSPLGNAGNGPSGFGTVGLAPSPTSGNANCVLAEGHNQPVVCVEEFTPGTSVSLRVTPTSSIIESLNGCTETLCQGCGPGVKTCQVVMNGNQAVSVVFNRMR
jgi:hypothetical protein